jgi:hypothetical protein
MGDSSVPPRASAVTSENAAGPLRADRVSDACQGDTARSGTRSSPNVSPTTEAGRCAWCGEPCTRYGPDGKPFCDRCSGGRQ